MGHRHYSAYSKVPLHMTEPPYLYSYFRVDIFEVSIMEINRHAWCMFSESESPKRQPFDLSFWSQFNNWRSLMARDCGSGLVLGAPWWSEHRSSGSPSRSRGSPASGRSASEKTPVIWRKWNRRISDGNIFFESCSSCYLQEKETPTVSQWQSQSESYLKYDQYLYKFARHGCASIRRNTGNRDRNSLLKKLTY